MPRLLVILGLRFLTGIIFSFEAFEEDECHFIPLLMHLLLPRIERRLDHLSWCTSSISESELLGRDSIWLSNVGIIFTGPYGATMVLYILSSIDVSVLRLKKSQSVP